MIQDSVVAIVPEDLMATVLAAVHRDGLGHLARMIRPKKRNPLLDQLQRAGVPVSQAPDQVAASDALLYIAAAARSPMAGLVLMQRGATRVWIVSARGAWNELEDLVVAVPSMHVLPPHPAQRVPGRDPNHSVREPSTARPVAMDAPDSEATPLYLPQSPAVQDGGNAG